MTSSKHPLISVLLCVYNDQQFIQQSISSILSQTYENWELIVIDDGSQDGTYPLLNQINDPRVKIFRQANCGLTRSLNIAASHATGEFLARQDADDVSLPDRFERQIDLFKKNPDLLLAGSDVVFIDDTGRIVSQRECARNKQQVIKYLSSLNAPFSHGSIMMRKSAFDQVNGYDESYPVSQDFDLFVRMSQLNGEMGSVPKVLYQWRVLSESVTVKKWRVQLVQTLKSRKKIKQIYPKKATSINFVRFLITKIGTGLSFFLFSPKSFYYYRMAAMKYNQLNVQQAQTHFKQ
ncbi:MAG: glycosyltransferase, partial [Candidatus Magnetomorum sp.]|nr:glycosyltransferase [Candidatus Magnetomorum sp.]